MEVAAVFLCQAAAEYAMMSSTNSRVSSNFSSLAATLAATQERIEVYVGHGNLKYLLIAGLALMVVLLVRWRR